MDVRARLIAAMLAHSEQMWQGGPKEERAREICIARGSQSDGDEVQPR